MNDVFFKLNIAKKSYLLRQDYPYIIVKPMGYNTHFYKIIYFF